MSSSVAIREAKTSDAAAIARQRLEMLREVASTPPDPQATEALFAPTERAIVEHLTEGLRRVWIAELNGALIGSVVLHVVRRLPTPRSPLGVEGYIDQLYVAPPWRDSAIGSRLLGTVIDAARNANLSRIRLHSVDPAVRFYERNGFTHRTNDMEYVISTGFENTRSTH